MSGTGGARSTGARGWSAVAAALGWLLVAAAVVRSAQSQAPDDGHIVWRFVDNLMHGGGWAFTAGEPVSGCTSPLQVLLLAFVGQVGQVTPITANLLLSTLALAAASGTFAAGLRRSGASRLVAWLSGLAVVLLPLHRVTFGLEGHLQVACLGAFWLAWLGRRWATAGVVAALAVLARADTVLVIVPIVVAGCLAAASRAGRRRSVLPLVVAGGVILLPWFLWSLVHFGALLPNTLAAKQAQGASGVWPVEPFVRELKVSLARFDGWGWFGSYKPFVGVLAIGLLASLLGGATWPFVLAALLHAACYRHLRVPFFHWYALLLHLAIVLSPAALATSKWARRWPRACSGTAVMLLVLLIAGSADLAVAPKNDAGYARAGTWLATHTSEATRIACYEIGQVGWAARPRPIVDLAGLVTPAAMGPIRRGEFAWVLAEPPDGFVLHDPPWPRLETTILEDPRFAAYERVPTDFGERVVLWLRRR